MIAEICQLIGKKRDQTWAWCMCDSDTRGRQGEEGRGVGLYFLAASLQMANQIGVLDWMLGLMSAVPAAI